MEIKDIIRTGEERRRRQVEESLYYTESKPELEFHFSDCSFSFFNGVLTINASHAINLKTSEAPTNIVRGVWLYAELLEDETPSDRWQFLRDKTRVIIMRGNITEIPYPVFNHFVHLHTIVLPESLRSIGYLNFVDCPKLKYLFLPKNVEKVHGLTDINRLLYIDVAEENNNFCSVDGYLMSKDKKTLIAAPGGLEVVTIPDGCEEIGEEALCNSHTKITIPASVREINFSNFYSDNIKEIVLGDYARQISLIKKCFTRDDSLAHEYEEKFARISVH